MKKYLVIFVILMSAVSKETLAEGWCNFENFSVITHGTKSNQVHIHGKLKDQSSSIWVLISDGNIGNANVSIALAAQMAGKTLSIYVDAASDTCANFPSWEPLGRIRHIKAL